MSSIADESACVRAELQQLMAATARVGQRSETGQGSGLSDKALNLRTRYAETAGTAAGNPPGDRMESIHPHGDDPLQSTRHYAQRVAEGVDLPSWAGRFFSSTELSVLGAIRDTAYNNSEGVCSLSVSEIARLVGVSTRTAARAVTVAIAAGVIERDGGNLINRGIHFKIG
jgi:hypothetical protein